MTSLVFIKELLQRATTLKKAPLFPLE